MEIKDLSTTPFEKVIACFLSAFEGYFVKLPEDPDYWRERFATARVNWELSFGMFDKDQLVGYIINGIDDHNRKPTAYNTGTGVLPGYRGKAIVDKLYRHAIPLLKEQGVEKCLLEVICENERAIKVYERTGFKITRKVQSFSGHIPGEFSKNGFQKCHFQEVINSGLYKSEHYSWDNTAEAVAQMGNRVQTWCPGAQKPPEDYLVMDPEGNVIQLESKTRSYTQLLQAAGAVSKDLKLKNVDSERTGLIEALEKMHFSNTVNQYEMERSA